MVVAVAATLLIASCSKSTSTATPKPVASTAAPTTAQGGTTTVAGKTSVDPWAAKADMHRGQNGKTFSYVCPPGGEANNIWGTETYTDDSSVCTAAVHVGLITFKEGGTVEIKIGPGEEQYAAGSANGVDSSDYGSWGGSFTFPKAPPGSGTFETTAASWSKTAADLKLKVGATADVACSPGGEFGSVWGTKTYTADSSICTAAVHAGLISQAKGGRVRIELTKGAESYEGSTANGVTSTSYGAFDPAFVFVGDQPTPTPKSGVTSTQP